MKITKRQLRRIIKEEKHKLLKEITPGAAGIASMGGLTPADQGFAAARADDYASKQPANPRHGGEHGVYDENYWESLVEEELKDYLQENDAQFLTPQEAKMIERSLVAAANAAIMDLVKG
jgi:hypothetical protein